MAQLNVQEDNSSFVRILWVDASGHHRYRVVQSKRFNESVKKSGVGLTFASMGMPSYSDGPAEESKLTGVGEIRLIPDLSTKRPIPWMEKEEMVLADMHVRPGEPWEYCPRETLRRLTKLLKDEFDLVVNAGFENEFYLLEKTTREGKEAWIPFDSGPYCSTSSYHVALPLFHEIILALDSLNITVEQFHAESGKGQFEVALGHTVATNAADNLVYTHEVIRSVARKHGLLATFVPKYDMCDMGSGSHVHLSLWQNGKNVFMASDNSFSHGISTIGEEFMAGVLFHLPAILAIVAPLPNSYDRIQPNTWTGAFQCWGKENREAPIRMASPPDAPEGGIVTNFEIKSCDGCANPHLGLAAIVAAGIDGLRNHLRLPEPIGLGHQLYKNPSEVAETLKRLPQSLSEALEALQKDSVLHDLLGHNLSVAIKGVRKAEIDYYFKNPDAYKQLIHRF